MKISQIGIIFNLYFVLFLLFIKPHLLIFTDQMLWEDLYSPTVAAIIIGLMVAEIIAIAIKVPNILHRADRYAKKEVNSTMTEFPILLGRSISAICFASMAFIALGGDMIVDDVLFICALLVVIAKEVIILSYIRIASYQVPKLHKNKKISKKQKLKTHLSKFILRQADQEGEYSKMELFADLLTWLYVPAAFTVMNATLAAIFSPISQFSGGEMLMYTLGYILIFIMTILPLRISYIIEEIIFIDTNKERLAWSLSTIAAIFIAVIQIY